MHKLIINRLGPIERCEMRCTSFMTLTGFQASGKSTIAKAVYYFRTVKEDIEELAEKQALDKILLNGLRGEAGIPDETGLKKGLENCLREKFLNTFGSSWGMSGDMYME